MTEAPADDHKCKSKSGPPSKVKDYSTSAVPPSDILLSVFGICSSWGHLLAIIFVDGSTSSTLGVHPSGNLRIGSVMASIQRKLKADGSIVILVKLGAWIDENHIGAVVDN